jgi:acetyl-CoA acetyltransferase
VKLHDVAVLGVGMVRFGSLGAQSLADLAREAGLAALADAGLSFRDVGEAFVGYVAGTPMTGVKIMKEFGLTGLPVTHVENASATGLVAFREAAAAVSAGHCDVAMALGFDKMTAMMGAPRPDAGARDAKAAPRRAPSRGVGRDQIDSVILPASYFALWATRRMHERGTRPEHFARIAAKNWNHGALNPFSHRQPDHRVTVEEVLASPMVSEPLTAMMACPVSDGAACAIVARKDLARRRQPGRPIVAVRSSSLQSERYTRGHTFVGPVVGPSSMTRDTALEAYEQAGVGPEDVHVALCHDAFANEELEYYELLGFCTEAEKWVEEGAGELGGRIPMNTDGGLIARGHPAGPTGLAQIHELALQLRGDAGRRQVPDARVGLAHLVGGGSVCCVNILCRD